MPISSLENELDANPWNLFTLRATNSGQKLIVKAVSQSTIFVLLLIIFTLGFLVLLEIIDVNPQLPLQQVIVLF